MRVKRHKPEDLADALKQLKLTDRRSRLSLRGRATNSFGILSSSTIDGNLRCRLTRSVSSTTSSSHNPRGADGGDGGLCTSCVCECCTVANRTRAYVATADCAPYRQSMDSSLHLGTDSPPARFVNRTGLPASSSGFSPFTTSAGLLYSTLPTNFDFSCTGAMNDMLDQQRAYHSSKMRRSYGAGLSSIDVEPSTQPPSTSRGSFGSVLTTSSDKHHCCPHHNLHSTQSSNQMRLYRRLYSLIDHPSVSLYHSCRSPACPHSITSSSRFSASHRHSLSLRHRHTVTPTSPFYTDNIRFRSSFNGGLFSASFQQDCHPPDVLATNSVMQPSPIVSASADQSDCGQLSGLERIHTQHGHSEMSSHLSTFAAGDNDEHSHNVSQPSVRCRRNSDPERWQQLRTENTSKLKEVSRSRAKETTQTSSVQYIPCHSTPLDRPHLQPTCADNSNGGSRPASTLLDGLSLGFGFGDGHIVSRPQQFGTFKSPLYAASTEGRTLLTNADQFGMMVSNSPASVLPTNQSSMGFVSGPAAEHVVPSLISGGANPNLLGSRSIFQSSQAPHAAQFSFRPSMLTQATKMMEAEEQCSVIGDGGCRKRKCCLASVTSPWTDDGVTPTATAPMDGFGCAPHTGHPVGQTSTIVESDSMFKNLQRELSTLEQNQQQDATESLSTGPNRQPMSDVSVNELAAYMEHMVHIPGRMSEMAQRMYL